MTASKKILLRLGAGVVLLLILFAGFLLLLPRLIHLGTVKTRLESAFSERTGGTIRYRDAEILLFPRPVLVLRDATLAFPGRATGSVDAVALYPDPLPLLRGKVRVGAVRLEKPDFRVRLPEFPRPAKGRPLSLARLRDRVRLLLAKSGGYAPNLVVDVTDGRISLSAPRGEPITLRGIRAKVSFPPGALRFDLACASTLWKDLSFRGSIDTGDLRPRVRLTLRNLRPEPVERYLFPAASAGFAGEISEFDATFRPGEKESIDGVMEIASPSLTVRRGGRTVPLAGIRARGSVHAEDGRVAATLAELKVDEPRLALSGNLSVDRASPVVDLEVRGTDLDVRSIRAGALALADDLPAVRETFSVLRGGKVRSLAVDGRGRAIADLGRIGNLIIRGEIREGALFVPGPALSLADVRGTATIVEGVLSAENAGARMGRTRGRGGRLTLGLGKTHRPFRLSVDVQADLAALPPFLARLVKNEPFRRELSLLEEVRGNASGSLLLEGRGASVRTKVDVTTFHVVSRYRRFPFPLEVRGGRFSYDEGDIRAEHLSGSAGRSSFSDVRGRLRTRGTPRIERLSGEFRIDAEEVYPWIASLGNTPKILAGIGGVTGTVSASLSRLEAPLRNPGEWRYEASGDVQNLVVESSRLPGPVSVARAAFRARNGSLSFSKARGDFLDSSFTLSGNITGPAGSPEGAEGNGSGRLGPKAAEWIAEVVRIPPEFRPRPPLDVTDSEVAWTRGGATSFRGNLLFPGGPTATVDLRKTRESLSVPRLDLRDGKSVASLSLELGAGDLLLAFSGSLTGKTLERILADRAVGLGEASGDFRAHIVSGDPVRSSLEGTFEGKEIAIPWMRPVPLVLDRVSLDATGDRVRVNSTVLRLAAHAFLLDGEIRASSPGWVLDMDASADTIDWDRLGPLFAGGRRKAGAPPASENPAPWEGGNEFPGAGHFAGMPVTGDLRLSAGSLTVGKTAWKPFRAEIALRHGETAVRVVEAARCGISFPGVLRALPEGLALDVRPAAKGGNLEETLSCLGENHLRATGTFDLEGTVAGRGIGKALAKSLRGSVDFEAKDGRIHRMTLLAKVFALLNITEAVRGKAPDLVKEGFSYESMTMKGDIRGGSLVLKEAVLKGPSMEIFAAGKVDLESGRGDLELLLAPFRTVDFILRRIPLLRYILGGTLVSIPVKVTGDLANPTVTPLAPDEIGSGILDLIGRTLTVPFRVIQPLLPSKEGG